MPEQYDFDYSDLDEYLVEYVDGTMDSSMQAVFEELMVVDPAVMDRVEYLRGIRTELCRLGDQCQCQAPAGFQSRLRRQLACEMMQDPSPVLDTWTPSLHMLVVAFSALLVVGVVITTAQVTEHTATQQEPSREVGITNAVAPSQTAPAIHYSITSPALWHPTALPLAHTPSLMLQPSFVPLMWHHAYHNVWDTLQTNLVWPRHVGRP